MHRTFALKVADKCLKLTADSGVKLYHPCNSEEVDTKHTILPPPPPPPPPKSNQDRNRTQDNPRTLPSNTLRLIRRHNGHMTLTTSPNKLFQSNQERNRTTPNKPATWINLERITVTAMPMPCCASTAFPPCSRFQLLKVAICHDIQTTTPFQVDLFPNAKLKAPASCNIFSFLLPKAAGEETKGHCYARHQQLRLW